ncbi:hypothetical protein PR048_009136 [Dryococelus australis]|uniref:Secreted protein n=1 Tax=Dryococelus australis TaxID=614101 RepID=A0ABQ9HZ29_9NEOP|nr:hypothetical protein PR048_009136 [Dryococelus australis]
MRKIWLTFLLDVLNVRAACSLTAVPCDMEKLRNWAIEIQSCLAAEREFVTVNSRKEFGLAAGYEWRC